MMVIDAHNHLGGPDEGDDKSQTPGEIIGAMDDAGVDMAVVFPFAERDPGVSFARCNDYIAHEAAKHPDRLIGFCRLDPNAGGQAVRELERCVKELGLKGVKLHPTSQNFPLDDPVLGDILEAASGLGVPAVFDTGKKASPPPGIARLAGRFPDLAIIMAHMNLYDESVAAAAGAPNILIGTTGYFNLPRLKRAIDELGARRFVSGSDSPYIKMTSEQKKFSRVPGIGEEERRLIRGENMRGVLGI